MKNQAYEHFLDKTIDPEMPLDLLKKNQVSNKELFFIHRIMPCCLEPKHYCQISRMGQFFIISCFHCGFKWHINPRKQFIEPFTDAT